MILSFGLHKIDAVLIIFMQCPFCHKSDTIDSATEDRDFCVEKLPDGRNQLKRQHAYYHQVSFALPM